RFLIRLKPSAPATLQVSDDGGSSFTETGLSGVTQINVSGRGGADTLTMDQGNGLVAATGGLAVHFDGGLGDDTLILSGNGGTGVSETFSRGTDARTGTLNVSKGSAAAAITFSSLEAIHDVMNAASLTICASDNRNVIMVCNC